MLELRPVCENCGCNLPPDSTKAMICTFECTFCEECVKNILHNVCPNCGGGLEKRPIRPAEKLVKYPAKTDKFIKPVACGIEPLINQYKTKRPEEWEWQ